MIRPAAPRLETISIEVAEEQVPIWEQAIASACEVVSLSLLEPSRTWRIEGIKPAGANEADLADALALATAATGVAVSLSRHATPADGWLARTREAFPEQLVGRFVIRGTHLPVQRRAGTITLVLDAGAAFGSGEHASTRGCLLALARVAHRRPRRILDLGTGSGILAMAAARLLHRPVLAADIDPWSVRAAAQNGRTNQLGRLMTPVLANGWTGRAVKRRAPYDLVLANILARPLCRMATALGKSMTPQGTAILAGLLSTQIRQVLAAHRRNGFVLDALLREQGWATLILRKGKAGEKARPGALPLVPAEGRALGTLL